MLLDVILSSTAFAVITYEARAVSIGLTPASQGETNEVPRRCVLARVLSGLVANDTFEGLAMCTTVRWAVTVGPIDQGERRQ
ncbi:hypothetical protein EV127DRAFT_425376 [Xylaria flabelliformis]|nr:hypothetical protein EV127DRAFT_425376 [Xylaria flabelliformis]